MTDAAATTTATTADDGDGDGERSTPPAPTRVVLVRHGVTAHTGGGVLTGRLPGLDLTDEGSAQARRTAERLAVLPVAAVYASPIERTMQTAQIVAAPHGLEVRICEGVLEAEYGDWSGQKIGDLAKTDEWKVVQAAPSRAQFPNGETLRAMQARTVAAIDELAATHRHETIVVVSHADPIKAAVAHYTGVHLDLFQRLHVSPASATVIEFHAYGVMMLKYNDTGSLDELVPRHDADASAAASATPPSSEDTADV